MLIGVYSKDISLGEGKGCVTPRSFNNGWFDIVGSRRLYLNDKYHYGGRVTSLVKIEVGFTNEPTHLAYSLTPLIFRFFNVILTYVYRQN